MTGEVINIDMPGLFGTPGKPENIFFWLMKFLGSLQSKETTTAVLSAVLANCNIDLIWQNNDVRPCKHPHQP